MTLPSPQFSLRRLGLVAVFFGLFLATFVSWGLFRSAGSFLDRDAISMVVHDGAQLLQHVAQMEPLKLVAAPLASLLLALICTAFLPAWVARSSASPLRPLVVAAVVLLAASAFGVAAGPRWPGEVKDGATGSRLTLATLDSVARKQRTGPVTAAVLDLVLPETVEVIGSAEPALTGELPEVRVERRPLLSLERWKSTVDRSRMRNLNVLVVLIESLRCDQLQACGSARSVLPAVDRLVQEGHFFSDNRTQASTSAYADPSTLSSQYPLREHITHYYPEDVPYPRVLIYDLLKALGWRTAIISSQNEYWGNMLYYLDTGSLDYILHAENYEGETYVPRDEGFLGWVNSEKRAGKIDDRFTVDEAIRWLAEGDSETPFFLYLNLQNSHIPYTVPADFPRRFGPESIDFPITIGHYPRDKEAEVKGRYADSLAYVDSQLERLFDALRESREWEDTLIVVSGDTGQAFYEHGFAGHAGPLYDEVMRVPLVIRAPGLEPAVDSFPSQHIDIPPSILHLLGLPPHPAHQGLDLFAPDRDPERSRFLVVQTSRAHQYAIVRDGWKLIWDAEAQRPLLYDLRVDPEELRDLSGSHAELEWALADRLLAWQKLQLQYHRTPERFAVEYPPVLVN